jgi:hypothetical protein
MKNKNKKGIIGFECSALRNKMCVGFLALRATFFTHSIADISRQTNTYTKPITSYNNKA